MSQEENKFVIDTEGTKAGGWKLPRGIRIIVSFSTVFMGALSLMGISVAITEIQEKAWLSHGMCAFAWSLLYKAVMLACFIGLLKIARNKRAPFSKTLIYCVWTIGGLFLTASVVFPRLPGYSSSGFEFLSWGSFVFIDGAILLPGLLFLIFGSLIKAGFEMQREIDEIL